MKKLKELCIAFYYLQIQFQAGTSFKYPIEAGVGLQTVKGETENEEFMTGGNKQKRWTRIEEVQGLALGTELFFNCQRTEV